MWKAECMQGLFPSVDKRKVAKIIVLCKKCEKRRCCLSLVRIIFKMTTLKSLWRNKKVMSLFVIGVMNDAVLWRLD